MVCIDKEITIFLTNDTTHKLCAGKKEIRCKKGFLEIYNEKKELVACYVQRNVICIIVCAYDEGEN